MTAFVAACSDLWYPESAQNDFLFPNVVKCFVQSSLHWLGLRHVGLWGTMAARQECLRHSSLSSNSQLKPLRDAPKQLRSIQRSNCGATTGAQSGCWPRFLRVSFVRHPPEENCVKRMYILRYIPVWVRWPEPSGRIIPQFLPAGYICVYSVCEVWLDKGIVTLSCRVRW